MIYIQIMLKALLFVICFSVPITLLAGVILVQVQKLSYKQAVSKAAPVATAASYLFVLLYVLLLYRDVGFTAGWNLIPLNKWLQFDQAGWFQLIGLNLLRIGSMIPIGFLAPVCFKRFRSWWFTAGFVLLYAALIETLQLLAARGVFDIDDIIGSVAGGLIGYGVYRLVYSKRRKHMRSAAVC